jgi:hypothetical protein
MPDCYLDSLTPLFSYTPDSSRASGGTNNLGKSFTTGALPAKRSTILMPPTGASSLSDQDDDPCPVPFYLGDGCEGASDVALTTELRTVGEAVNSP